MTTRDDATMKRWGVSRRAFLKATAGTAALTGALPAERLFAPSIARAALKIEKEDLKFGFIKLTDMAPIAIAKELNFFEDEGLFVSTEPQANWKVLLDRVITGELDGAHMLAGQPLGATIGFGTKAHVITPFSMDLNGNGITVSNAVWEEMKKHIPKGADGKPVHPIKADALKKVVEKYKAEGKPFNMGMVFPLSTHNYELRYWLASGGIHPGFYSPTDISGQIMGDVLISVTPPPQMPATMEAGTILGYCVGEPWNQAAVFKGIGVPVITDYEIWKNNPEKVFGMTAEFARKYPNTVLAVTKALIRAGMWLDENNNANRRKAVQILAKPEYVGADAAVIANSMTGTFEYEKGDKRDGSRLQRILPLLRDLPLLSRTRSGISPRCGDGARSPRPSPTAGTPTSPSRSTAPTSISPPRSSWSRKARRRRKTSPGTATATATPTSEFIDGVTFDGRKPNAYIDSMAIGLKGGQRVDGAKVVSN